jgi:hypothetical protein
MRVADSLQGSLKKNDRLVYTQTLAKHRKSLNTELKVITHFMNYIIFLYDESMITLMVRGILYIFLSNPFDEASYLSQLRMNTATRIANAGPDTPYARMLETVRGGASTTGTGTGSNINSNTGNVNESSPTPVTEDMLFGLDLNALNWTQDNKKMILRKTLLGIIFLFIAMVLFQAIFCLGDVYSGFSYGIWGGLKKSIRNTAYVDDHLGDSTLWNANDAFTNGYFALSIIGETKLRSGISKFFTLLVLDCIVFTIYLFQTIINLGVQFGAVADMLPSDADGDGLNGRFEDQNEEEEEGGYDGYQGRTLIHRINIRRSIRDILLE